MDGPEMGCERNYQAVVGEGSQVARWGMHGEAWKK
jgi:hypothetical protein